MNRQVSLGPLSRSHLLGAGFAAIVLIGMMGVLAEKIAIPAQLGFRSLTMFIGATPALCGIACAAAFLVAPVQNNSQRKLVRWIGRIPIFGRYFLFSGVLMGLGFLEIAILEYLASSSIQSLTLADDVSRAELAEICQEVGDGVTFQRKGNKTCIFFLNDKKSAVERSLQKQHLPERQNIAKPKTSGLEAPIKPSL